LIKIEMHFLPDIYVTCEVCKGRRYTQEVMEVRFKGHSIADVLSMSVDEALLVFRNQPGISRKLQTLVDVGLGYLHLGQPATQLSGGEAQRVKLATELSRRSTGRTLYILDEPTTGLHFADVEKLLGVLHRLVDQGNTVVVIEHNLDVLKSADWLIDLGPDGGAAGGRVLAEGAPEQIAQAADSATGAYLAPLLAAAEQDEVAV
jgi:excinuclease ABC subunit A